MSAKCDDMTQLGQSAIVTDSSEASFIKAGVKDLAAYLEELTGVEIPVYSSPNRARSTQIAIGTKAVQDVFPESIPSTELGEEGYVVKVEQRNGKSYILCAGRTPHGTKAALAVLMKSIRFEDGSAFVSTSLNKTGKPAMAKRGMHFNGWAFQYPYSFRCWSEADWKAYLDIMSYQGVNLFYLWPFIEIMPAPLSREDEEYLKECRRVVDYAQKRHGMEVWIMQCTNRVAKDRCDVDDPRKRPYWRPSQEDLNPGNPEHLRRILESREAMYRIIDNADGVCNIDSDPGFCPGSSLDDYLNVLRGCRELLDRLNVHGKQTKLINWMLWGWGRESINLDGLPEHQRATLRKISESLPEPWELICSQFGFLPPDQHFFLPICAEEGVLSKAVFLPYGNIEFEPSYPKTNLEIDQIRGTFKNQIERFPELAGAMGNIQTPLLQFPDEFYFTSAMFDAAYRDWSEPEVIQDLARLLHPEQQMLVADCFMAMKETDSAKISALADKLDDVVRNKMLGRPGAFGRKLFPSDNVVAKSLLLQLRLRATLEALVQGVATATPKEKSTELLRNYFDAYLAWDTAHGWHALWGWEKWPPSDERLQAIAGKFIESVGGKEARDAALEEIAKELIVKYNEKAVREGCVEQWKKLAS
jgi:hypothetical protein